MMVKLIFVKEAPALFFGEQSLRIMECNYSNRLFCIKFTFTTKGNVHGTSDSAASYTELVYIFHMSIKNS